MAERSMTAAVLTLMMIFTISGALLASADTEPNDDEYTAETITPGIYSGIVDYMTDSYDYYKFQAGNGDIIRVTLESNATDDVLMFYCQNSAQEELIYLESMDNSSASGTYYTNNETGTDWYYLIVEAYGSGNYTITLTLDHQDDAGSGGDAPGTTGNAVEITAGEHSGHVEYGEDDYDYYKFWTGGGAGMSVEFISYSTAYDLTMYLYDQSESEIFYLDSINEAPVSDTHTTSSEMEWYYIAVEAYGDGNYTFILSISGQDDAGQGVDAPSDFGEALNITDGSYNGTVTYSTDQTDMYKFWAGKGDIIRIEFTYLDEGDYLTLKLHDKNHYIKKTITSNGTKEIMRMVTSFEDAEDWFYIGVEAYSSGNYSFVLNITDQNDGGSGGDAPGLPASDLPTITPSVLTGTAGDNDVSDFYNITVDAGDIIWLAVNATGTDVKIHILDDARILKRVFDIESNKLTSVRLAVDWNFTGTNWMFCVINAETYEIDFSTTHQNDAGSGTDAPGEPNVDYSMITNLTDGNYTGYIDLNNDMEDYYRINIKANETVNIIVESEISVNTLNTWISSRNGTALVSKSSYNGGSIVLNYMAESDMDLYFVARSSMGFGNYTFNITLGEITYPERVKDVTASWSGSGVRITWNPPESQGGSTITKYKIYRRTSTSDIYLLYSGWDGSFIYNDTTGVPGTTYIYGVAAVNAIGTGPLNESDPVTYQSESSGEDSDYDGMPDSWETTYGLDPNDPTDAVSDTDGDGVPALSEYQGGSDPTDVNSVPGGMPIDDDDWFGGLPGNSWAFCACGSCGLVFILIIIILVTVIIIKKRKGSVDEEE